MNHKDTEARRRDQNGLSWISPMPSSLSASVFLWLKVCSGCTEIRLGSPSRLRQPVSMTETEKKLLETLLEFEKAVQTMAQANPKPNLLPFFARLDELTRQLPPEADPSLRHYLQKKSYEKARLFLQGREADNAVGNCGHVP